MVLPALQPKHIFDALAGIDGLLGRPAEAGADKASQHAADHLAGIVAAISVAYVFFG